MEWVSAASQLLLGIAGLVGVGGLLKLTAEKRKVNAEADRTESEAGKADADTVQVITGTALTLLAPLREQVESLTRQLADVQGQLNAAQSKVVYLTGQVDDLSTKLTDAKKVNEAHEGVIRRQNAVLAEHGINGFAW